MGLQVTSRTRQNMRQDTAYNLGTVLVSTATATGSTTTLIDTQGLAYGGTDDYIGQELIMISGTTANIGKTARVTAFNATTKQLTFSPAMTATASADGYELHETFLVAEINNQINQAILGAADEILIDKVDDSTLGTLKNEYEYTIPTGFVALSEIGYEYETKIDHLLDDCETAWTAGTGVTATADSSFKKIGTYSCKLVVGSGALTGALLGYHDITSVDISDCDKIEFWMYSSIALAANYASFVLDDTLACASATNTITIPAMDATTWYKHSITLSNPHLDTAIVSIGIKQYDGVDFGACTIYLDDIHAILAKSRIYRQLSPDNWGIVQGTSPQLQLDEVAYDTIGDNKRLRLHGYKLPSILSDDTTSYSEIDPDYVVAKATANLGSRIKDFNSNYWLGIAEKKLLQARTLLRMNTRWVS